MKKIFLLALAAVVYSATAQQQYFDVMTSPDSRHKEFRPNQVIVKLKNEGAVEIKTNTRSVVSSSAEINVLLDRFGIEKAETLMPLTGKLAAPARIKSRTGQDIELKDLSKLYCLKANHDIDVNAIVKELSALPEVEFAEPNYLVYACATSDDWKADPHYSQQWGIPAINADKLWDKPVINSKRPVIAILDTGVDISHPDLAANIWTNEAEVSGMKNLDDDNNGFKDDIHGWDFVNQTAEIDDYNGHGTHCAGIAAAVGGNGKGIVGANPDALIMPVTVMQSDGTGDVATIIKGIDYAAANGADVISMSFGGYSYSAAEEQALAKAYTKAVLVAAAGNDGKAICRHQYTPADPMFPAAFTFVLGVQATMDDGRIAGFSNQDTDGPIYFCPICFNEEQMYNYELKAPGVNIISTYPGGQYKSLNGTSMACPLVAGAISRLYQIKEIGSKETLFSDLIHTASNIVDIEAVYNLSDQDRKAKVNLVSWRMVDEKDSDGRFDAGETINFYATVRNEWGEAKNIKTWIELGENEGDVIELLQTKASFDKPLSAYGKAETANPFRFKIKDNVVDGRKIRIVFKAQCDGMDEPIEQEITIEVENGIEINGIISEDVTLEPDQYYIVTGTILIDNGATLTIKPGTRLCFKDNTGFKINKGDIVAKGTKDQPIIFTSANLSSMSKVSMNFKYKEEEKAVEYAIFENLYFDSTDAVITGYFKNCRFRNLNDFCRGFSYTYFEQCQFDDCLHGMGGSVSAGFLDGVIKMTETNIHHLVSEGGHTTYFPSDAETYISKIWFNGGNNICSNQYTLIATGYDTKGLITYPNRPSYLGSTREDLLRGKTLFDMTNSNCYAKFDLSNMLTQPNPACHGVVWKVVVDGCDAQDEFEQLPPLGVGKHKFEIWYSKVIDQSETPTVAMGLRPPYTQTAIAEDGSWRTETVKFLPNGNVIPEVVKNVVNGNMDNFWYDWTINKSSGSYAYSKGKKGFDGNYSYVDNSFVGKFYQDLGIVPNGVYKFTFKALPTNLAGNGTQYIFANGDKTYLDSTEPKVYEVTTTVTNNRLEVGFEQLEGAGDGKVCLDDANVEMVGEPLPYGNDTEVSVYSVYLTIKGGMAIDGLNRIFVHGCKDFDNFEIPREDYRYNVEVAVAGSMSTGFMGEAGIGKVSLSWNNQEGLDDMLGYNIYRYEGDDESKAKKINKLVVEDSEYIDYDVKAGTTYNYFYKIMRTDLSEGQASNTVSITPTAASKGDANGSSAVDVADVVTEIQYITGGNPKPFIFDAADINDDKAINILDVVGTVNIILKSATTGIASVDDSEAVYYVEDGILYVETPVALGGLQISVNGCDGKSLKVLDALNEMEIVSGQYSESGYLLLAYSMTGKYLAPGKHALLNLSEAEVETLVFSDTRGNNVTAVQGGVTAIEDLVAGETTLGNPFPNPFVDAAVIPFEVSGNGKHNFRFEVYDMLGHIQHVFNGVADCGKHSYTWNAAGQEPGVYVAVLKVDGKHIGTIKLIKK